MADAQDLNKCGSCGKSEGADGKPLKRCAKCQTTRYCSRDCQKADFKKHKKECSANAARHASTAQPSASQSNPRSSTGGYKNLDVTIDKPFHKLSQRKWLHGRSEDDVFKLLLDSHRLRINDDYRM
jgi:mitochondrial splicing suppressor protein 51